MNYFGHAVIAARRTEEPDYVLGAMLPDFASMLGVRLGRGAKGALAAGIAFHHETDEAFHGAVCFVEWEREAAAELRARGVSRHPARAAAHVGIEMLLDGWLLEEPGAVSAYLAALSLPLEVSAGLWPEEFPSQDWAWLRERLLGTGAPLAYREVTGVSERLLGALGRRRRLALDEESTQAVTRWLVLARGELPERAPALLAELRARLLSLP